MKHFKYAILLFALTAILSLSAGAISIRSLLGLDEEENQAEETVTNTPEAKPSTAPESTGPQNWADSGNTNATTSVNFGFVRRLLANVDESRRSALLADEATFKKFVANEANNLSVLSAARANKVNEDANIAFLMERGADNVLREIYLNRLMNAKLPKDFPTDEQVKDYYEKNKEKFVIGERVHVWQIFLPIDEDMDDKAKEALQKKALDIVFIINKDRIDFNAAAAKYSKHAPSNVNGGYMGLIKTSDLKPEIEKVLMKLDEGKLSAPVRTDTGIHIVKRGIVVPERKVSLNEGKGQIRALLIKQVQAQLRQAIYDQAAKTYPVDLADNKIEEWRLRLKTNLSSPSASTAPKQ